MNLTPELLAIPLVCWGIWLSWTVARSAIKITLLERMHHDPDEYGFGTRKTNELIASNTRAMRDLSHYIQWSIKQRTGQAAPPPLPEGS